MTQLNSKTQKAVDLIENKDPANPTNKKIKEKAEKKLDKIWKEYEPY